MGWWSSIRLGLRKLWRLRKRGRFICWRIWEIRIVLRAVRIVLGRRIRITLIWRLIIMVQEKVGILENWTLRNTWLQTGRVNMWRLRDNIGTLDRLSL